MSKIFKIPFIDNIFWAIIVSGAIYLGSVWHDYKVDKAVNSAIENKVIELNKEFDIERQRLLKAKEEIESDLGKGVKQIKEKKDEQIKDLNSKYSNLLARLRKYEQPGELRKPLPEGNSGSDSNKDRECSDPATCYREGSAGSFRRVILGQDAEFLVSEAMRADSLRLELQSCYQQYDAARDKSSLSLIDASRKH